MLAVDHDVMGDVDDEERLREEGLGRWRRLTHLYVTLQMTQPEIHHHAYISEPLTEAVRRGWKQPYHSGVFGIYSMTG